MRDMIRHGCDTVDYQTLWDAVKNDLPFSLAAAARGDCDLGRLGGQLPVGDLAQRSRVTACVATSPQASDSSFRLRTRGLRRRLASNGDSPVRGAGAGFS